MTIFQHQQTPNNHLNRQSIFRIFASIMIGFSLLFGSTAQAQIGGSDIGDIINDIFKNRRQPDAQNTISSAIEIIPVTISFDPSALSHRAPHWRDGSLIISAYAPQPTHTTPDNRTDTPIMIGQTRILIADLTPPINLAIAVSSDYMKSIDYARIDARMEDANSTPLLGVIRSEYYRGENAVALHLVPNLSQLKSQSPPPAPTGQISTNTLSGLVHIGDDQSLFRGSKLVLRLIDDGLAGSSNTQSLAQNEYEIDQVKGPYPFDLTVGANVDPLDNMLAIDGWVEDWAGRKTHTIVRETPFTGTETPYTITMKRIAAATPTTEAEPNQIPEPSAPPRTISPSPQAVNTTPLTISTRASFNAHKGLPSGSVLLAELEQASKSGYPNIITTQRVALDGLSGDINFDLVTRYNEVDPELAKPMIRVRIEDQTGRLFFSNPGGAPLRNGLNVIQLTASPLY